MAFALADLANANSSAKRRDLLRTVSNLFVAGAEAHSDREILLFGEVLEHLIAQASLSERVALAATVGPLPRTPRGLALKLAGDQIEVARPVLESSPVLSDDDLVDLASRHGQQHLAAISRRQTLCEAVTDVLVERGDTEVLNLIARNLGARLSPKGLTGLLEKSSEDAALGESLSQRADLPEGGADCPVSALLSPAARDQLRTLVARSPNTIRSIFEGAFRLMETARADQRRRRVSVKVMAVDVREGRRSVDEVMGELIEHERTADLVVLIATLGELQEAHVRNALHQRESVAIATACRALGVAEETYGEIARLRRRKLRLAPDEVDAMLREFQEMDPADAQRAIRFHKIRVKAADL